MKKERIPYDEMKALYQKWMNGEIIHEITQAGFFLNYGWNRNDFFDEASRKGDSV